jgi:hypothetical protein
MVQWLKDIWNNPKRIMRAYGRVLLPKGLDKDGNVIYRYNEAYRV